MNSETLEREEIGNSILVGIGIGTMICASICFLNALAIHDLYNLYLAGFFVLAGAFVGLFTRINEIEGKLVSEAGK